jgi:hypothetical protein
LMPAIKTRGKLGIAVLVVLELNVIALESPRSRASVKVPLRPDHRRAVKRATWRIGCPLNDVTLAPILRACPLIPIAAFGPAFLAFGWRFRGGAGQRAVSRSINNY